MVVWLSGSVCAQIRFPKGNRLDLQTTQEVLYLDTRILFHTGKYLASDYRWEKQFDSLDQNWFVTSCFNGDCRNDLLQSGRFVTDFGLNDTTCFIAFHVESKGINGTSKIRYRIYNTLLPADSADLIYHITYSNPAGLPNKEQPRPVISNPCGSRLMIRGIDPDNSQVSLWDLKGNAVCSFGSESYDRMGNSYLLPLLPPGWYVLNHRANGITSSQKILLQ